MQRLAALVLTLAATLLLAACGGGSGAPAKRHAGPPASAPPPPAGARLDHIAWVVFENTGYDEALRNPFFAGLARQHGLASRLFAVAHPSLPNYLAMTGGSTFGVGDDAGVGAHAVSGPSIFSQVRSRGLVDAMPSPCSHTDTSSGRGGYVQHHNPYAYFSDARAACLKLDVPYSVDQVPDLSAPFTFVVPDTCNDAHSCPLPIAAHWLERFLAGVRQTPQWTGERTAVVVTFDEDDRHEGNHIYTAVVSNQLHGHVEDTHRASLYTLLGTTEDLLGLPRLRAARGAGSIADLFVSR